MKKIQCIIMAILSFSCLLTSGCKKDADAYVLTTGDKGDKATVTTVTRGEYVTPNVGNPQSKTDTEKPIITASKDYSLGIEAEEYVDIPDVLVTDNVDSNPFLKITATDPNGEKVRFTKDGRFFVPTEGEYSFRYNSVDSSGNVADEFVLQLYIADNSAPVVNLRGMDTVNGYTHTKIKLPSILLSDYYDCELNVLVGKKGAEDSEYVSIDEYALEYRPSETGEYDVRYVVTEKSSVARQTIANVALNVTDLTTINACEGNAVDSWGFGGEMSVNPKPSIVEDKTIKSAGNASIKVTLAGSASQMQYGADATGFITGTSMYSDFSYCGTTDISGYQFVKIDVYNANAQAEMVRFWVHDNKNTSRIGEAQVVEPQQWITLSFSVQDLKDRGLDVEHMMSVLVTFQGHADGTYVYNVDNFRVE